MNSNDYTSFDSNAITISGFFGALTFTAMVLLMQFADQIKFSEILIPWTAIVSFFFIIVTIGLVNANVAKSHPDRFRYVMVFCFLVGFYGLIFVIPALVYSFSEIGAYVILIIEIIIVVLFNTSIDPYFKQKSH